MIPNGSQYPNINWPPIGRVFFENHHPDQQPDTVAVKTRDPPASHTMAVKDDEATKRRRKTA